MHIAQERNSPRESRFIPVFAIPADTFLGLTEVCDPVGKCTANLAGGGAFEGIRRGGFGGRG